MPDVHRENLLTIKDLSVAYSVNGRQFNAVSGVSMEIPQGAIVGLVGESGSGKSTVAKAIAGLAAVSGGSIVDAQGRPFDKRSIQMVFQDPYGSLNPRMRIGRIVREGVDAARGEVKGDRQRAVSDALSGVALSDELISRLPSEISGGQRQRVAIARAIAARPKLLLADEITSALDVSVRGDVLNALLESQRRFGFGVLFISHDISVVSRLCDFVYVMYCGRVVECGPTADVIGSPAHPYTRGLLASVLTAAGGSVDEAPDEWFPVGDPADPMRPPPGCRFHPRCPIGPTRFEERTVCREVDPALSSGGDSSQVACHFWSSHLRAP